MPPTISAWQLGLHGKIRDRKCSQYVCNEPYILIRYPAQTNIKYLSYNKQS